MDLNVFQNLFEIAIIIPKIKEAQFKAKTWESLENMEQQIRCGLNLNGKNFCWKTYDVGGRLAKWPEKSNHTGNTHFQLVP